MSDSVRPHRWQPTRLPHPWDSPGKNTGVGCHFLLQCMKVKSESEVTQSCLTLCDPMDYSLPGSSIHGIFQARVLEWGAIAFSMIIFRSTHIAANGILWQTNRQHNTQWCKAEILPTKICDETKCPLSPFTFNIVLEILSRKLMKGKKTKVTNLEEKM